MVDKINAEVISVYPNKVRISVDNLENFQVADEKLRVGSYLRIADNDDCVLVAVKFLYRSRNRQRRECY